MRKILSSFLAVFLAFPAYAENVGFNNEADKTVANTAGTSTLLATDKKGKLILGALSGIYAEDAAFANGGSMMMSGAVNNGSGATTFNTTNGDVTPFAVNRYGAMMVDLSSGLQGDGSPGNSPIRSEDSAFSDTQIVMMAGGVNNRSFGAYNSTNGDVTPFAVGDKGTQASMLMYDSSLAGGSSAIQLEDDPYDTNQQALVRIAARRQDAISSTTTTDGDATEFKSNTEGALYVQAIGGTTSGGTIVRAMSAASNNSTNVKASAGQVYSVTGCNINAAVRYLKLYNKATAPTCGTDTPVLTLLLPVNGCNTIPYPIGSAFSLGIGYCIVTGITDADNTSTAANEQTIQITYK